MLNVQLPVLYLQVFGFYGRKVPGLSDQFNINHGDGVEMDVFSMQNQKNAMESVFGDPIYMPVKLGEMWLPNEPLISLTGSKRIVKTVISGLKGEVIEEMSMNAYQVTIQGVVTNEESDDYPGSIVGDLRELFEREGPLKIVNKITALHGIHQIQIESWNIFGIAGAQSEQAYQVMAWSYRPVELVIKEGI